LFDCAGNCSCIGYGRINCGDIGIRAVRLSDRRDKADA
jgi:hypothetical protein